MVQLAGVCLAFDASCNASVIWWHSLNQRTPLFQAAAARICTIKLQPRLSPVVERELLNMLVGFGLSVSGASMALLRGLPRNEHFSYA